MIDEFSYPKYTNEVYSYKKHPDKWEIPFLLEHIFDIKTGEYVKNPNHCCYYSPVKNIDVIEAVSDDESIAIIEDGYIISKNRGVCNLEFYYTEHIKSFKIKLIVYKGNFNYKLKKNTLFLKLGNIIKIDTVLKHINCSHYTDCLFESEKLLLQDKELVWDINQIRKKINDYQYIINEYHNGNIIYHNDFEEYYIIDIIPSIDKNGIKHHSIKVNVKENFVNHIKSSIKKLRVELRDLVMKL